MSIQWAKMPYHSYRFSGTDNHAFLQGQLTQDISVINKDKCSYGAYCNHQGAMFANFLISRDSKSDIILRIHESQSESVIKRLKMFVLRSAVDIELNSVQHIALNKKAAQIICKSVDLELPKIFCCVRNNDLIVYGLPGEYFELVVDNKNKDFIIELLSEHNDESLFEIESLRINTGNFHIYPETSELLLPQETPLEKWGAISYTKGCYVGQEIIARSKYRGKIRKGFATSNNHFSQVALNSEILADDRNVGVVIEVAHEAQNSTCLATLNLSAPIEQCEIGGAKVTFSFVE
ncbi:MAG: folate-binding protein YgfZ [Gammaproteobacteria bacterium]|nr:folate-binding protein YgfZ [Gammaproteobacteria bacterium]